VKCQRCHKRIFKIPMENNIFYGSNEVRITIKKIVTFLNI